MYVEKDRKREARKKIYETNGIKPIEGKMVRFRKSAIKATRSKAVSTHSLNLSL